MNVLLSAYACEPGKGSEPGIGWHVALEMARYHDVWVVTRANNRGPIEAFLSRTPVPRLRMVYFDLPRWARWWKRGGRGVNLYYYLWQLAVVRVVRRLHRDVRFDLVHHITFGRYWSPSFLSALNLPMVWGPVGGGESAPRAFWQHLERQDAGAERKRELARRIGELDPAARMTARRSAIALATTNETAARLHALGAKRVEVLAALAIDDDDVEHLIAGGAKAGSEEGTSGGRRFRVLSLGRLVYWKGFHLGLRAFAAADLEHAELVIVGDGPDRRRLEALASELSIEDRVTFLGRVPRERGLTLLSDSDVLLHPSFHDSGGFVCVEAMAVGTPVVCLALGGPDVIVTDETGIKVPADDPARAERGLVEALRALRTDHALRIRMAEAGVRRVRQEYGWTSKGLALDQVYREAIRAAD